MAFLSPLRYPGGKGRIANYIKLIFLYNDLMGGIYIEPYAGGAAVALDLLFNKYATSIYINDISKSIFAIWFSILNYPDEFCSLIKDTKITIKEWERQKELQKNKDNISLLELGFSTFFLNRTNYSGIIEGGVIGGKKQSGSYKLNARFNKKNLINRIERIANHAESINVFNYDAEDFIDIITDEIPEKSLIYLDPPYYKKGRKLYENYYDHKDHVRISKKISSIYKNWIISYDRTMEIEKMYSDFSKIYFSLGYSAAEIYKGNEVMYFSNGLIIPQNKLPCKVTETILNEFAHQT